MSSLEIVDPRTPPVATDTPNLPLHQAGDPGWREIIALVAVSFVVFISTVSVARNYAFVIDNFGDSLGYMNLASALRHWNFSGIVIKQFWGLPYAMAAFS